LKDKGDRSLTELNHLLVTMTTKPAKKKQNTHYCNLCLQYLPLTGAQQPLDPAVD
jgi:hypothetical protein